MHRQAPIAALAGLAALALTGCTTFTDQTAAARVGDAEISHDEVVEILSESPDGTDDAESVRDVTWQFVANELVKADLQALGVDVPDTGSTDLPIGEALLTEFNDVVQIWQGLPVEALTDPDVETGYTSGSLGVCVSYILFADDATAETASDELDDSAAFSDIAAIYSIDPNTAGTGGFLGCTEEPEALDNLLGPDFADAATAAEVGEPFGPFRTPNGPAIGVIPTVDTLPNNIIVGLRFSTLGDRYDIYVDPGIGSWTDTAEIIPLG